MSRPVRSLAIALGVALSLAYLQHAHSSYRANVSGDYYQFWVIGQALTSMDLSDPYSEESRARIGTEFWQRSRTSGDPAFKKSARYRRDRLEPAGTPFLYTLFRALSTGRYGFDYEVFRVLSFLGYAVGVVAFARMAGLSLPLAGLAVLLTTQWFWPFRIDVAHSNVNQLQLALLAGVMVLRRVSASVVARVAVGAGLALLFLFKPNLLYAVGLLFCFWALSDSSKGWAPIVAGFAVAGGLALLASAWLFGSIGSWGHWLAGSSAILQSDDYLRRSLPRLLGWAAPTWSFWVAGTLLCVPILVSALRGLPVGRVQRLEQERLVVAAGGLILVLCSPVVHVHYFVLTVPAMLCLMAPGLSAGEFRLAGVGLRHAGVVIALLLIGGLLGAHFTLWPFLGAFFLYLLTVGRLSFVALGAAPGSARA